MGMPHHATMNGLYFAYGSNMNRQQMERRCPQNELLGVAVLAGYRFLIGERGYATLTDDPAASVMGALYRISVSDEEELDRCEGVAMGCYRKACLKVSFDGGQYEALTYLDDRTKPAPPREGYMARILAGARQLGLPAGYRAFLESFSNDSRLH